MRPPTPATTFLAPFLALAATAGAEEWVPLSPVSPASAEQVEIDTSGPANLYALHETGVMRSRDGGLNWDLGREGLPGDRRAIDLLADPHRPDALYLAVYGVGVYRSIDAGKHWHPAANEGLPDPVRPRDLEAHPTRPETLYLTTAGDWIYLSEDGGDSWRPAGDEGDGSYDVLDVVVDPADPDTLYAVGAADRLQDAEPLAFRSEDGGETWQRLDVWEALDFFPYTSAVAVPPGGTGAVYVASFYGGVIRSLDAGATWTRADAGLPAVDEEGGVSVVALATHPTDPSILYAGTGIAGSIGGGVFRTTDGGDHWLPVGEWRENDPVPADLALHPDDPSLLFAAPGPWLSPVGGTGPWRSRRPDLPRLARFVTPHPHDPETLFTGSYPPDLLRSPDGGVTWERFATSITPTPPDGFHDLVVDPADPATTYLLGGKKIYKSEDGGLTWVESDEGIEEVNGIADLTIHPTSSQLLYAWNGFRLYRSTDGGDHWAPFYDPEGAVIADFAIHPDDPEVLYVATSGLGESTSGVCRSADGGGSWTCGSTGLARGGIGSLVIDPADPRRLYLIQHELGGVLGRVLRSVDGGESWTSASAGLPETRLRDLAVQPDAEAPAAPSPLWVATDGLGAYRSADGGATWTPVRQGMGPLRVNELSVGPGGLYAATSLGVYRLNEDPDAGDPSPPEDVPWLQDASFPGFRFKVRIDQGGGRTLPGTREPTCLPETVCVSGAVPGRSEVFLRIVGPKPNGWLWPTLVKFSTSRIEVWIQQLSTDRLRYYELRGASPGFDELPGLFDRFGFTPEP